MPSSQTKNKIKVNLFSSHFWQTFTPWIYKAGQKSNNIIHEKIHHHPHLEYLIYGLLGLLAVDGECHLLGAVGLLQLPGQLGPPLLQHGHVELVRLVHLAHRLLVLPSQPGET